MAHDDTVTGDFSRSWSALLAAVAGVADEDFDQPSGCRGWLVRDLVCHLVIDAQDVLITLVTPAGTGPTADATTYWDLVEPPTGDDPLDALIPRLAAAYGDPALLKFHLDDVGSAAGRAAGLADPAALVSTKDKVLTAATTSVRTCWSGRCTTWTSSPVCRPPRGPRRRRWRWHAPRWSGSRAPCSRRNCPTRTRC